MLWEENKTNGINQQLPSRMKRNRWKHCKRILLYSCYVVHKINKRKLKDNKVARHSWFLITGSYFHVFDYHPWNIEPLKPRVDPKNAIPRLKCTMRVTKSERSTLGEKHNLSGPRVSWQKWGIHFRLVRQCIESQPFTPVLDTKDMFTSCTSV